MTSWRAPALVALFAVLTGCSSAATKVETSSTTTTESSASAGPTRSAPPDVAGHLFSGIRAAVYQVKTVHFQLYVRHNDDLLTASGIESLRHGRPIATSYSVKANGHISAVIQVSGKTYISAAGSKGAIRPWRLVVPAKTPVAGDLGLMADDWLASAPLTDLSDLGPAATSVKVEPTQSGSRTTQYGMYIDVAKLPPAAPSSVALRAANVQSYPLFITVDSRNRPTTYVQDFEFEPQGSMNGEVDYSEFDQPVSITRPPSSKIDA